MRPVAPSPRRRALRIVFAGLLVSGPAAPAASAVGQATTPVVVTGDAPTPTATSWFRVFLTDGTVLTTLGEFTRVDDVVVVQVPVALAADGSPSETRTASIAAADVDWGRTEAYRESLRRAQFERAGGERAYAAFTEEVAATLRDVALLRDPLERIRRLESARARLAQWPLAHHGYRAEEVAETLSVVDDLLAGMRAAAGQQAFSLAIATTAPTPASRPATLLPPPTLQDVVAQALRLAPRVGDPSERLQLLESASALLARADRLDARWARDARSQVRRQISAEQRVTRAYARVRSWMLEKTATLLALADVRGLMRVRQEVEKRDARLQHRRPAEVAALLATLDARLETARRQRLLLERWEQRRPLLERYASVVSRHLVASAPLPRALEDVKALAGPEPALLTQAEGQLAGVRADAGTLVVPDEAKTVQQVWASAQQLAQRALQGRRAAVRSGDLQQAWEASAAAAGALMLLQQLRGEVAALTRPPALPASPKL